MKTYTLFWFRRDLRLYDNAGLFNALRQQHNVLPLFIFDTSILKNLNKNDARVEFIYQTVLDLKEQLKKKNTDLIIQYGEPVEVFKALVGKIKIKTIVANHDYEPYARKRDESVKAFAEKNGIIFSTFKDHVIFEKEEIQTDKARPYTVYTPYKKKWLSSLSDFYLKSYPIDVYESNYAKPDFKLDKVPTLESMGFEQTNISYPKSSVETNLLIHYEKNRDLPYLESGTSRLGLHLRFGTISIRQLACEARKYSPVFLSELIWRDFFTQILWHFPEVQERSFREEYEKIDWIFDKKTFELWCQGKTGYPLVDAGMRELNATGYMHNRVRMVTASFLTKHLLHHWKHGEAYFAEKLLDYDLALNNGNWQWAAGTGCDAAPYFRIFNPETQMERFDPEAKYIKKWVPEYGTPQYTKPIVDHKVARERALVKFKSGLGK
ncbi:MAG: cryptochrome/photolyase family protein [Pseudobdellovibrio sp.]